MNRPLVFDTEEEPSPCVHCVGHYAKVQKGFSILRRIDIKCALF